ncbi:hypothetical protein ACOBV9_19935 (plasmid) [Pseudoalteromonas espejiana]
MGAYLVTVISEGLTTKSWSMVGGTVISSNGLRIQHNQERYIIEVEYSYMVDEKLFVGNRVSNVNSMLDRAELDLQLKKYQTGIQLMFIITLRSIVIHQWLVDFHGIYLLFFIVYSYGGVFSCEFKNVIKKLILKRLLAEAEN